MNIYFASTMNARECYNLITYDAKSYRLNAAFTSTDIQRERLLSKLYANDYTLVDMKSEVETTQQEGINQALSEKQQKQAETRKNSLNIYDFGGNLTDEKGERTEAFITIKFESIEAKPGRQNEM